MKSRRSRRKKKSVKPKTKVDKNLDRRIKAIEGAVEWKHLDFWNSGGNPVRIPFDAAGAPYCSFNLLNFPIQGTGSNQRIGNEINCKSLHVRIKLDQDKVQIGDSRVRVSIIRMKNPIGSNFNGAIVYDVAIAPVTFAHWGQDTKEEYKVLYDKTVALKPLDWDGGIQGVGNTIPDIRNLDFKLRLGFKTKFIEGSNTGTYVDIASNGLWAVFSTSSNVGGGAPPANNPNYLISTRMFYTDG